jgi:hypothetical protein
VPVNAGLPPITCGHNSELLSLTNHCRVRCDGCIDADTAQQPESRGGTAIAARKRALTEWEQVNPDTVYDPELFRRGILPRLGTLPLAEIMEAAGCSKASASDYRRGKRTPHVSTWKALAELVGLGSDGKVSQPELPPMSGGWLMA